MKLKLILNPKPIKSKSWKAKSPRESMPVCTLILPDKLYKNYLKNWNGSRPGATCLKDLLELYGPDLQFQEKLNPDSALMMYQKKEEGRQKDWSRLNFRPDLEDWNLLGNYARKHGVSKCYLFTFLLSRYFSDPPSPEVSKKKKVA
ncbi:DUF1564 family protein [Leptospira selangorensis]|uniref:DUF1564 family protein n=1 Tax=Leptospira selangorensis TaxID=2484982 RepID=A0A4R9GAM5_9LEPT|nr:DUF1564 family protein [Leptospira selangorensis]TGK08395.1 DUF1564 family protein [Leptospira selangorensis]TGM15691.1 DUF1564 family protein [Leptospira selangorensis]TGM18359.1 DUF1564 family protein [Leptospira selangorensis]